MAMALRNLSELGSNTEEIEVTRPRWVTKQGKRMLIFINQLILSNTSQ